MKCVTKEQDKMKEFDKVNGNEVKKLEEKLAQVTTKMAILKDSTQVEDHYKKSLLEDLTSA